MKRYAVLLVFCILLATYYLSSIPGLQILPVLSQVNNFLISLDAVFGVLAENISASVPVERPDELGPFIIVGEDALVYVRENPALIEFILRKVAHVFLFFVITIAFFLMLRYYFNNPRWSIWCTFLCATAVAVLDEYHQTMVPGRIGSFFDVGINLIGIFIGIFLIRLSFFLTSVHSKKAQNEPAEEIDNELQKQEVEE